MNSKTRSFIIYTIIFILFGILGYLFLWSDGQDYFMFAITYGGLYIMGLLVLVYYYIKKPEAEKMVEEEKRSLAEIWRDHYQRNKVVYWGACLLLVLGGVILLLVRAEGFFNFPCIDIIVLGILIPLVFLLILFLCIYRLYQFFIKRQSIAPLIFEKYFKKSDAFSYVYAASMILVFLMISYMLIMYIIHELIPLFHG